MTLATNPSGTYRRPPRSWSRLIAAALVVVALLASTGCVVEGRPVPDESPTAAELGLPQQSLLTMPIRRQPVPGWTLSAAELGLDPGDGIRYSPISNVGDRAIFQAVTKQEWWVIGVDVGNGTSLFEPVSLGRHGSAEELLGSTCFANGPSMVMCLRDDDTRAEFTAHAWVIDTDTGTLLYGGPTHLRSSMMAERSDPMVHQLGDYLVATVEGHGVYGIGRRAELTWHVPGTGSLSYPDDDDRDVTAPVLAAQSRLREPDVVFSLADGRVIAPTVPAGEEVRRVFVYPDGFAYELRRGLAGAGIAFFDNNGREQGRLDSEAHLLSGSDVMPMAQTETEDRVLNVAGKPLLKLPKSKLMPYTRLAGTTLLVSTDEDNRVWRQFDLRSGDEGATCENDALWSGYIGSSGDVVIVRDSQSPARAIDLATCETLWAIPSSARAIFKDVWRVNTTLVMRVNDELSSLVAPE